MRAGVPSLCRRTTPSERVAPYAGGSSDKVAPDDRMKNGCPVCGREFLLRVDQEPPKKRLPRMRAGVPAAGSTTTASPTVAPYAGGSSAPAAYQVDRTTGCPVCGREFRSWNRMISASAGLPRMRAGVPCHCTPRWLLAMVAPYAGGSSHDREPPGRPVPGCPVCGREFRRAANDVVLDARLPRMRAGVPRRVHILIGVT